MKIEDIKYKYLLELMENRQQSANRNPANGKGLPTIPEISKEVHRLLSLLTDSEQKTLISLWLKYNLAFDTKPLTQLLTLLKTIVAKEERTAYIKAAGILLKHKLPLLPPLINGLARNLNPHTSLTEQLKINRAPQPQLGQNPVNNLFVNITDTPERLAKELEEYPVRILKTLEELNLNPERAKPEIYNQLLGQQLLNNQDKNLLLVVEIPFFIPEYNKLFPGYLQIRRDGEPNPDNNHNLETLKITFLIALEKRGLIRADAIYQTGPNRQPSIQIGFYCSSPRTKKLAEKKTSHLKKALQQLNLQVTRITIELIPKAKKEETEIQGFYDNLLEFKEGSSLPWIQHINLRV